MQHETVKWCLMFLFKALSHWHIPNMAHTVQNYLGKYSTSSLFFHPKHIKHKTKNSLHSNEFSIKKISVCIAGLRIQLCHSTEIQLPGKHISWDICLLNNIYWIRHGASPISWLHLWKIVWLILRGIIVCEGNSKHYPPERIFSR